jgi:hypothetical protein
MAASLKSALFNLRILTLEFVSMAVNYYAILITFATLEKVGPKKKFYLNF